jgi:hypothetical protein
MGRQACLHNSKDQNDPFEEIIIRHADHITDRVNMILLVRFTWQPLKYVPMKENIIDHFKKIMEGSSNQAY